MNDALSGNGAEQKTRGQELATSIVHTVMSWHLENDRENQEHRLQDLHGFAQEYLEWLRGSVIERLEQDA
jgi:hypothetical protein